MTAENKAAHVIFDNSICPGEASLTFGHTVGDVYRELIVVHFDGRIVVHTKHIQDVVDEARRLHDEQGEVEQ